ncbi:methyl-accepting chemotaxis protein [Atlantibacter hermannii]|uniref:methyl-accepting chemotaxis protein n=1 Tax=Atlantibacter hermannii TaxID=565 RepID=UPI002DB8D68B|nr:methyl-accepting chemotaxis protein [Atlantibacter hermannii]MEB7923055.1 methyl-accepting chemotaxis protein [Atlantibacter hermannii]
MKLSIPSFKNLPVAAKLFGGFSILIAIIIASSLTSIYQADKIKERAEKGKLIADIHADLNTARRNRLTFQINHSEKAIDENKAAIDRMRQKAAIGDALVWSPDTRILFNDLVEYIPAYDVERDTFVKLERITQASLISLTAPAMRSSLNSLAEKIDDGSLAVKQALQLQNTLNQLWDDVYKIQSSQGTTGWSEFNTDLKAASELTQNFSSLLPADTYASINAFNKQLQANVKAYGEARQNSLNAADRLTVTADKLDNVMQQLSESQTTKSLTNIQHVIIIMIVVAVCAVFIGILVAWLLTRQMTRQIRHNLTLAEQIAKGDLTCVIEPQSTDELGRLTMAMAVMNDRLREMITQIKESVSHVANASSEISVGNIDLASRTEEQAAAVVETAASMEELTSTVKRNAENAREASKLAVVAAEHARSGGSIVWDVVNTMGSITESSKKISEIINVINGISFQTNILALNAAVEAARAGEQGRGFAVVAGEVRALAQRSANAAKEIADLIKESVDRVHAGADMANKAGISMEQIVSSVTNVSGIMSEISDASDEQSRGIDQIGKAVTELDATTQQNAALVHESSAAASSLEEQAGQLARLVSAFRLGKEETVKRQSAAVSPALPVRRNTALTSDNASWESF